MACNSLTALPRACSDGIVAGLEKMYIIAFKDLTSVSGSTEVYATATNGTVNNIGFVTSSVKYVEVGLLKSTSGLSETLTKDTTKGVSFFTQTYTTVLGDLTIENQTFIKSTVNQPVSVIYKTRTGKYFVIGLNGQLEMSAVDGGTGIAESDLAGHTLTFSGISKTPAPFLDSSILTTVGIT